jgi:2-polyprenyl-3-methyl-5-hydroxy-6-metoxy-1,4-benzoquinol methylase
VSIASSYWLDGFSRVWREEDAAEEDAAVRSWYRDLLSPYLPVTVKQTLDVGCGSGRMTSVLAELSPAATHVAIDGSAEAVRRTARRISDNGIAGVARVIDITVPRFSTMLLAEHGRFDVITCFFVIHHYPIETIARILAEYRELCERDGVIVLAECHDPADARARTTEETCAELARMAGQPPDLLLTPDALARACVAAGFSREEMQFEVRHGQPFTERERARHTAELARLQARVSAVREHAGPSPELRQLESLVETMSAQSICGPIRHPPALAVLRPAARSSARRLS